MQKALNPYRLLSLSVQICASFLLLLMFFIAVEKGVSLWDEVQQEQIELSENSDTDAEEEDCSEEDSDDFIHAFTGSGDAKVARTSTFWLASCHKVYFRCDVFTPPPEV